MNTELNILKQISKNKGKTSVQLIAKELKMRNDYIRYLCLELIKKGLAKKLKGRDWYKITRKGEKVMRKPTKKPKKHISVKKGHKMKKKIKPKTVLTVLKEKTAQPEEKPEASRKIETPTVPKVNKITKALKNLFRIKEG